MSHAVDLQRAEQAGLPLGASNPDPPLHCFPLRIDWEYATGWTPAVEPFPAPLATSTDKPAPGPVANLYKAAVLAGWTPTVTYAHGFMPHATHGRPGEAKESWALRLTNGDRRAVAVRLGASWSSLWTWSSTQFFARHGTLESFKRALS